MYMCVCLQGDNSPNRCRTHECSLCRSPSKGKNQRLEWKWIEYSAPWLGYKAETWENGLCEERQELTQIRPGLDASEETGEEGREISAIVYDLLLFSPCRQPDSFLSLSSLSPVTFLCFCRWECPTRDRKASSSNNSLLSPLKSFAYISSPTW